MQRIIIISIVLILIAGIYLLLGDTQPTPSVTQTPNTSADNSVSQTTRIEAQEHIESLTRASSEQALDVTRADNFVTADQLLSIPAMQAETARIEAVSPTQAGDTPNRPDRAPESIIDKASPSDRSSEIAVTQAVDPSRQFSVSGSSVMVDREQVLSGTLSVTEGINPALSFEVQADGSVAPRAGGSSVEQLTQATLRPGQEIRLRELLSDPELAEGTVFYLHAVSPEDEQGLWGILQHGLIQTFAQGIKLNTTDRILAVEIPALADETLENRRSSFLGNFLYQKVQDTYVYNYQQGILGRDPNLIKPGLQLVIVSYSEDELITIYNHFTRADS